jgi:hypothetical protein
MAQPPIHALLPRGKTVAVLVVGGLVSCIVVAVFMIDTPPDRLPGIALGSEAILAVERIAALFTAWLLTLVVVDRAVAGQLPTEISGRGVRYADGEWTQAALADAQLALSRLDGEVADLRGEVFALRKRDAS